MDNGRRKVVDEPLFRPDPSIRRVYIFCPGCKAQWPEGHGLHCLNVTSIHTFNGDYERPTFSPSLMAPLGRGHVCHSFVREGMIQFLEDCTHPLRGQTVPLLDVPDEFLPDTEVHRG